MCHIALSSMCYIHDQTKLTLLLCFLDGSPSGNMSWQGQSLQEAFFALDPSRAMTEFDSAVIYLAFYFMFIKKQVELWYEGQGLAHRVNETMHLSVYCSILYLFQSALQKYQPVQS